MSNKTKGPKQDSKNRYGHLFLRQKNIRIKKQLPNLQAVNFNNKYI